MLGRVTKYLLKIQFDHNVKINPIQPGILKTIIFAWFLQFSDCGHYSYMNQTLNITFTKTHWPNLIEMSPIKSTEYMAFMKK